MIFSKTNNHFLILFRPIKELVSRTFEDATVATLWHNWILCPLKIVQAIEQKQSCN